ncbi:MAG: ATP--guanido phosphotransferase [Planctomycetota bacterium]
MLKALDDSQCQWVKGGQSADVVLISQICFARNIAGYPFLMGADDRVISRIEELVRTKIMESKVGPDMEYHRLEHMDDISRNLLVERQLLGSDYVDADWPRGVACSNEESISLRVNEEDHLRIQVMLGGSELEKAWKKARNIDNCLADYIPFAFSSSFGYLTASPANVGTGMHASAIVHLPAMGLAKEMDKIIDLCAEQEIDLQGLYGDGSYASADVYRLSNQVTLGKTEDEIVDDVGGILDQIVGFERKAREVFHRRDSDRLRGRIERAHRLLGTAADISCEESLALLSQVRLGVQLGEENKMAREAINRLLLLTLPAHLQTMDGRSMGRDEMKKVRAAFLKKELSQ